MVPPPTRGAPSTSRTVAVWLALGLMLLNALQPTPSHAEHPAGLLSERVHNRLVTVQADVTAGDLDRALTRARALLGSLADKPYDHAMVLQALGHIHIARAEWSAALEVLEQALRLAVLEPARAQDIRNKLVRLDGRAR